MELLQSELAPDHSLKFDPTCIRRGLRHWREHMETTAKSNRSLRRDNSGMLHQVGLQRLRGVEEFRS
jgi:hypothetical protein